MKSRLQTAIALADATSATPIWRGILHQHFEKQCDARPEAVAVIQGEEEATYADLDGRANRIARYLRRRGVRRGSIVALLLPRSIDAYAALLGILKAGAAYVPLDPDYPPDRVSYILKNCGAQALVTTEALAGRLPMLRCARIRLDADRDAIVAEKPTRLIPHEVGVGRHDLCYIIYTSGTTGRPKGVSIEHGSAWNLVQAEGQIFRVQPEDRVYQGASLSFDLSVEEVWLAFHADATLVAATPEMAHAGPDLSKFLTQAGVTVLSCVPTLLAMLVDDVPTLRLLILGGEACPDRLVARWARPGRRMVNTYGPTETTVIATYGDLAPGKPVTLGRAVPGYRLHILNEELDPVPRGEIGEICIGGPGVARGYVGLHEETRTRFVPDSFAPLCEPGARLYRTGDLGRFDAEGNLEFHGRADAQVKLRGFRVELSEIESVMMQAGGVLAAACTVREDIPGVQQLVGYIVPRNGTPIDEEHLRVHLRNHLPAFMVPAIFETVDELPRLPSGKLDRKSLPQPRPREGGATPTGRRPHTDLERRIAEVWERLFSPRPVSVDDHFFLDLGGHSLLAARMVSELRKDPHLARVSVTDVYEHPTVASLASALEGSEETQQAPAASRLRAAKSRVAFRRELAEERRQHFLCGLLQSAGLYFVFGFRALEWVTPYLVYILLASNGYSVADSALWAVASAIATFPALTLAALAAKWLVLGRARAGRYPLWGGYYLRWWFVQTLVRTVPLRYLDGTPLLPIAYRLFGARIGKDVHIATDRLAAFDLISIGDGACIDDQAQLLGYSVERRELLLGPVKVGRRCFVGTRSVLSPNTVMEDGARLEDLSLLPAGTKIPKKETWAGSPARQVPGTHEPLPAPPVRGWFRRAVTLALYAALALIYPSLLLAAIVPGMIFLLNIDLVRQPWLYLVAAPFVGASFVILLTCEVIIIKWLLVGRVRAGRYPVHGAFYIRKWIVDQLLALSLELIGPIHATLYLAPWFRALGSRLGEFVELSTALSMTPDLLEIGDESTVADEVLLGAPRVEGGWMILAPTCLGRRAFLGNSAVVPTGSVVGDGSLVGVLSLAPADPREGGRPGTTWLGSPPLNLPRRQPSAAFPEERTFRPTRKLRMARGAFEILRVTLPPSGFIIVTAAVTVAARWLWHQYGLGTTCLLLPVVYTACCAVALLIVALAKWTVIGRFRAFARPLWSNFIWRLELQNALYEFLATPLALEVLKGTPMLPWYLRLLGAKIGRRVYLHTTGFLEFDLAVIGDRVTLNDDCVMQTHLFEDRVLKSSRFQINSDCVVGAVSVILYDSKMEPGSRLDALSLLMKGETLPAGTSWAGIPATWQDTARVERREKEQEQERLILTAA